VQELEDEDDDPASGENRDDGGHAREEGLDGSANAGMLDFARCADWLGGVVVHCSG